MQSASDNIEIMIYDKANDVIKEHFQPFLNTFQIGLETSMKGSDIIFDCIKLLLFKFHKTNLKHSGSLDI